jgi:hypothetical protein
MQKGGSSEAAISRPDPANITAQVRTTREFGEKSIARIYHMAERQRTVTAAHLLEMQAS